LQKGGSLQALIDFLIRNLMALWPIARVYSWQIGLRIRNGVAREELRPGLHFRMLFIDEIIRCNVVENTVNLQTGSVVTVDDQTLSISANIAYRITSPKAMWLSVQEPDDSIADIALGKLISLCSKKTWHELKHNRAQVERWLRDRLVSETKDWGIEITRVFLTDCVPAKQIRLFNDGATAVIDD
jgi:membrane protease subunit HflK